jgi:hypothetical protein
VTEYEPNSLGKMNRRLSASLRNAFGQTFDEDLFSGVSAVSLSPRIDEKNLPTILERLKSFPQLQKVFIRKGELSPEQMNKILERLKSNQLPTSIFRIRQRELSPEQIKKIKAALPKVELQIRGSIFGPMLGPVNRRVKRRISAARVQPRSIPVQIPDNRPHRGSTTLLTAKQQALQALIEALKDENQGVRLGAVLSLGKIGRGSPEALAAILFLVNESDDPNMRKAAVRTLGDFRHPSEEVVNALINVLTDRDKNDKNMRAIALNALSIMVMHSQKVVNKKMVNALFEAAKDEDEALSQAAYDVMGVIYPASDEVLLVFVKALKDDNAKIRRAAAFVLGRMKTHER